MLGAGNSYTRTSALWCSFFQCSVDSSLISFLLHIRRNFFFDHQYSGACRGQASLFAGAALTAVHETTPQEECCTPKARQSEQPGVVQIHWGR